MASVADQDFSERLGSVVKRAIGMPMLRGLGDQLLALLQPTSLAIIATVMTAWVVGHLVGIGEIIDIIIGLVGFFSVGFAVFTGLDELFAFGSTTYSATTEADLDEAADHFAQAVTILGVQVLITLLLKYRPTTTRPNFNESDLPRNAPYRYKPKINKPSPNIARESGETTQWGDITLSSYGSREELAVAALHEKVHQFLTPKFYLLRRFRIENRYGSYFGSSLLRYVEEALAETIGRVGVQGFSQFFVGIRFPVESGYVSVLRGGGYNASMLGRGLVAEGAALLGAGMTNAFGFEVWYKSGVPVIEPIGKFMANHPEEFDAGLRAMN